VLEATVNLLLQEACEAAQRPVEQMDVPAFV
jgi:hypothetical protein